MLTLLQEVAKVADVKIDWNELVKKTNTGISSAREYQMLWRHLAYRNALLERLDEEDQPLVSLPLYLIPHTHYMHNFFDDFVIQRLYGWQFRVLWILTCWQFMILGIDIRLLLDDRRKFCWIQPIIHILIRCLRCIFVAYLACGKGWVTTKCVCIKV